MRDAVRGVISYSRKDGAAAKRVGEALSGTFGWRAFRDLDLPGGAEWERAIVDEIKNADCVIALVSKASREGCGG